jgi:ABC-type branched-subunit amino acid transport system permease subunit
MKFTFTGKALRAISQDRETAGLMGINQAFLIMLTIVIASAMAGMAGAMLGPILVLTPFAGASVVVKAFAIVIIGGFGNMEGTIIAGLLVGLIEAFTTQYLGSGVIDLVVFGLLLVMLLVRPTGLIAEKKKKMSNQASSTSSFPRWLWFVLVFAAIAALPIFVGGSAYWKSILISIVLNIMLAMSLNLILGIRPTASGTLPAFFGVGAYATTLLIQKAGFNFWIAMVASSMMAGVIGILLAFFATRLKGHYLAIASMAFAVILHQILLIGIA